MNAQEKYNKTKELFSPDYMYQNQNLFKELPNLYCSPRFGQNRIPSSLVFIGLRRFWDIEIKPVIIFYIILSSFLRHRRPAWHKDIPF